MGVTLVTPYQQPAFCAKANVGHDGLHHEYLHTRSAEVSHLHVGWNPETGSGFYSLNDRGMHPIGPVRFTADEPVIIGEYATWSEGDATYTQIGGFTTSGSIIWNEPTLVSNLYSSSRSVIELPGTEGVIAYVPDTTATFTTWTHIALPHSTTTTGGPGLIIIAWVRSFELLGQVIQRPDRPPRRAGEEGFQSRGQSPGGGWISRPQLLHRASINTQIMGVH